MLVATGRANLMVDPMMHVWDCAALQPVIEEAGGTFTDWNGTPTIHATNSIATNGSCLTKSWRSQRQSVTGRLRQLGDDLETEFAHAGRVCVGFFFFAWPTNAPAACILPAFTSATTLGFAANKFLAKCYEGPSSTCSIPSAFMASAAFSPVSKHPLQHFASAAVSTSPRADSFQEVAERRRQARDRFQS